MVATATLISRLLPENRFTHSFRFTETHPFFLPLGSTRAREFPFRAIARGSLAFRVSLSIPGVDRWRTLDRNGPVAWPPSLGGVSHSEINYTRENTLYYRIMPAENPPQPRVEALRYLEGRLAIAIILSALR